MLSSAAFSASSWQKSSVYGNRTAAFFFALGHLPSTLVTFGELTPILLIRCFLFNGGFGLFLGWLYRKYGILYAMMGHFLLHLVSKILLLLFI